MATGTDDTRRAASGEATRVTLADGEATRVTRAAEESTFVAPAAARAGRKAARGPGLATQFFVGAAVLVVATLGAAIAVGTWRANDAAEKSIRESLRDLPGVVGSYQISLEESLRRQLTSVADEPGTKGLFARATRRRSTTGRSTRRCRASSTRGPSSSSTSAASFSTGATRRSPTRTAAPSRR